MWGSVLVLALLTAVDPIRIGVTLLMISRPRPMLNLVAYWIGGLIASVPAVVVPLLVLHFAPMFTSFTQNLATPATTESSTVRYVQFGMGVCALLVAVVMTVRWARQRAHLPISGGLNTSAVGLDQEAPTSIARLFGRAQDAATEGGSAIRRLLARAQTAWEDGSWWVALVVGIGSGPPPIEFLFVLTTIVASGAAFGTQLTAGIAFVIGMLAVVEIILVGYLATPAKTQQVMRVLHDWARAHRRPVLVAILAVAGASLMATGAGGF